MAVVDGLLLAGLVEAEAQAVARPRGQLTTVLAAVGTAAAP